MPYNQDLANRVLGMLWPEPTLEQKRMFGGMAFMLQGNLACCVLNDDLIIRVPRDEYAATLEIDHVREMDYSGRPMRGWVLVGPGATDADENLAEWVRYGATTALALPPK